MIFRFELGYYDRNNLASKTRDHAMPCHAMPCDCSVSKRKFKTHSTSAARIVDTDAKSHSNSYHKYAAKENFCGFDLSRISQLFDKSTLTRVNAAWHASTNERIGSWRNLEKLFKPFNRDWTGCVRSH